MFLHLVAPQVRSTATRALLEGLSHRACGGRQRTVRPPSPEEVEGWVLPHCGSTSAAPRQLHPSSVFQQIRPPGPRPGPQALGLSAFSCRSRSSCSMLICEPQRCDVPKHSQDHDSGQEPCSGDHRHGSGHAPAGLALVLQLPTSSQTPTQEAVHHKVFWKSHPCLSKATRSPKEGLWDREEGTHLAVTKRSEQHTTGAGATLQPSKRGVVARMYVGTWGEQETLLEDGTSSGTVKRSLSRWCPLPSLASGVQFGL